MLIWSCLGSSVYAFLSLPVVVDRVQVQPGGRIEGLRGKGERLLVLMKQFLVHTGLASGWCW